MVTEVTTLPEAGTRYMVAFVTSSFQFCLGVFQVFLCLLLLPDRPSVRGFVPTAVLAIANAY